MQSCTRKTDSKARLALRADFASCLVTVERQGNELRIRKAPKAVAGPYPFRQLE
jgi:hypothetical protein